MDLFEIIGPVMVGPSSSHTAGAVRMGLAARRILADEPIRAGIVLHGSFAATGWGHGTDRALAAGLMGFSPDDDRVRDSLALAAAQGLAIDFSVGDLPRAHPNSALIRVTGREGRTEEVLAVSVGGGRIEVRRLNGLEVNFTCENPTLLVPHRDEPGCVARVTQLLSEAGINIAGMTVHRRARGGTAIMVIETDQPVPAALLSTLDAQPDIMNPRFIDAL